MSKPDSRSTYPINDITAGILAGGRATRMGGVDKGLVELAGRPMIEYIFKVMQAQARDVIINANRNHAEYQRYAPVVADQHTGFLGPLAGIASMMTAAQTPWLLTAPCDSPQVPADIGARLWQAAAAEDADIAVAHNGERLQPVFALLRCSLLPSLEAYLAAGERKIDRWYQQHTMAIADFSDCPQMFINVNTLDQRDDLAAELRAAD